MSTSTDLLKGSTKKLFFKYLIPSISATLVTSIYLLADSIIIGKGVSSEGLAALNILIPLFSFYYATGILFGVGGGILFSVSMGNGEEKRARQYFTTAFMMLAVVSIIIFILSNVCFRPLMYMLGATDESYPLVAEYGIYLTRFSLIFTTVNFFGSFVRNDKSPKTAMAATMTGGITNIVLDMVFIYGFHMGMAGGAIATVIGNGLNLLIVLSHFLSPHCMLRFQKPDALLSNAAKIFKSGISSFLLDIATGIVTLIFNVQILRYLGSDGLVVYSIISNSILIAGSFFNGVSQASQPLVAANFGAKQEQRVRSLFKIAAVTVVILGVFFTVVGLAFPEPIIHAFVDATPEVVALGCPSIRLYCTALVCMSLNIFFITYLQSTLNAMYALILSLLRGLVLCTLFIYIFPACFGTMSIWLVMPATEIITLIVGIIFLRKCQQTSKG